MNWDKVEAFFNSARTQNEIKAGFKINFHNKEKLTAEYDKSKKDLFKFLGGKTQHTFLVDMSAEEAEDLKKMALSCYPIFEEYVRFIEEQIYSQDMLIKVRNYHTSNTVYYFEGWIKQNTLARLINETVFNPLKSRANLLNGYVELPFNLNDISFEIMRLNEFGESETHILAIKNGMRINKVAKSICNAFSFDENSEEAMENQNMYKAFEKSYAIVKTLLSRESTMECTFSIEPMDYLTVSENGNGWSSCWRARSDSEYSKGLISTIFSPYMLVAYINNPTQKEWKFGPNEDDIWNNKIYRVLVGVSKDWITVGKEYPSGDKFVYKNIQKELVRLAKENMGWEYNDFYSFSDELYTALYDNSFIDRCDLDEMDTLDVLTDCYSELECYEQVYCKDTNLILFSLDDILYNDWFKDSFNTSLAKAKDYTETSHNTQIISLASCQDTRCLICGEVKDIEEYEYYDGDIFKKYFCEDCVDEL